MKKCLWVSLLLCVISIQANSAVIFADATGSDSDNENFWGVKFEEGDGFIKSVEFDLTPLSLFVANFDFDAATAPLLGGPVIGTKQGLTDGEISETFNGLNPKVLLFSFDSGSFESGDSFRFRADTDPANQGSSIPGHLYGLTSPGSSGLLITVIMEDGSRGSDNFAFRKVSSDNTSSSGIDVTTSAVPIPTALWLFGSGLILMRLRKTN